MSQQKARSLSWLPQKYGQDLAHLCKGSTETRKRERGADLSIAGWNHLKPRIGSKLQEYFECRKDFGFLICFFAKIHFEFFVFTLTFIFIFISKCMAKVGRGGAEGESAVRKTVGITIDVERSVCVLRNLEESKIFRTFLILLTYRKLLKLLGSELNERLLLLRLLLD